MTDPTFTVRIEILHPDPETESRVAKSVASAFLRYGVEPVIVIAQGVQETYHATSELFLSHPTDPVDLYLTTPPSVN